jgi:hypothetical protein
MHKFNYAILNPLRRCFQIYCLLKGIAQTKSRIQTATATPVPHLINKFLAESLNTIMLSTEVSGVISQPADTIQRLPES